MSEGAEEATTICCTTSCRTKSEPASTLRCRQMVAAENEGQCLRLNVLYDWGATVSMISEEAVDH